MCVCVCVLECTKESMLYLEWDGFVAVLESWTSVIKAEPDLKPSLVCDLHMYTYNKYIDMRVSIYLVRSVVGSSPT